MPSWGLVLFRRVLEVAREHGVRAETLRELWPNLKVFVHGGVKYAPFEPRVRQLYSGSPEGDDIPTRIELYPASEGFVAMQDEAGPGVSRPGWQPSLRLIPDIGNFYEFVPLEEIDDAGARAFTADEVEPGQRYVVVMSTCAGLWRYILGDVVEFDTVPRVRSDGRSLRGPHPGSQLGPARLRIVGRHRHFINAFGENLIVEHIEHGVAAAARATGLVVGEFTAAPVYPGPGRQAGLELAVELAVDPHRSGPHESGLHESGPHAPGPDEWRLRAFRDEFDRAVKAINVDYTTKRSGDLGMGPPTITPLPLGAFHDWLRSRGKLGGQHKCPRCANHREIIEAVCGVAVGAG
jgi:hypothetical protein